MINPYYNHLCRHCKNYKPKKRFCKAFKEFILRKCKDCSDFNEI